MDGNSMIKKTSAYVKERLSGEGSGHDWWHVYRVWKNATHICEYEKADAFIVQLGALLHDISDWKFNSGDDSIGPKIASEWLTGLELEKDKIEHVSNIIKDMSFKGAKVVAKMPTIEGMIVQDADRLDAIGAIGIARTFAYGGHKGREMHNPGIPAKLHDSFEAYKSSSSPTINHFYEKLLLLKDMMNTQTAKKIAEERHKFMEQFLDRFHDEWNGEK